MMAGDSAALAILSWVGYLTAILGNLMLLGYFVDRGEQGAALIQAVGGFSNAVMLTQVTALASLTNVPATTHHRSQPAQLINKDALSMKYIMIFPNQLEAVYTLSAPVVSGLGQCATSSGANALWRASILTQGCPCRTQYS